MKSPKSILITGASSGLGAALARHYAAPGIFLALTGRDAERLSAVAHDCREKGARVETEIMDILDASAVAKWITGIDLKHPVDLLIANAGISGGTGITNDEPAEQVRRIFNVNLTGVLNSVMPIIPSMTARRHGQIAVMSSLAGFCGWPGAPAYSASKGAVRLYGEALRGALKPHGVKVSVICPGFVRTPLTDVNPYGMPFLMEADKAAVIMARGLAANRARIAFPWPMACMAWLLMALPVRAGDWLISRMPEKE